MENRSRQQEWTERITALREDVMLDGEEWDHVDQEVLFLCRRVYRDGVMDGLRAVPTHPPGHVTDSWRIRLFEAVIRNLDDEREREEAE